MANERFACRLITSTRTDFCLTILSRGVAKQNFDRMFAGKSDILTQILAGSSCIYTCVPMHNRHFIPRARHSVFSDCCHDWQLVSMWAKWRRHQVIVVTNDCSPPAVWVTKFAGESPYAPKNIRQKSLKQRWLSSHKAKLRNGKYVLVSKKTFILYKPKMSLNEIPIDVCKINYTFRHLQMGCERLTLCHRMPTIFPFFTVWPWPLSSLDALDTHAAYAEKLRALMA